MGTARTRAWRRCQGAPAFSSSTAACTVRAETPRLLRWGPRDCQPARSLRAGGAVDGCWHTMRTPWAHRAKAPTDIETEPPLVYRHRCRARCCSRSALISRAGWRTCVSVCSLVCRRFARVRHEAESSGSAPRRTRDAPGAARGGKFWNGRSPPRRREGRVRPFRRVVDILEHLILKCDLLEHLISS